MIGELVEKLCIANMKLYMLCEKKFQVANNPAKFSKTELAEMNAQDINLCKQRAKLKNEIDKQINDAIIKGGTDVLDEVKRYGQDS